MKKLISLFICAILLSSGFAGFGVIEAAALSEAPAVAAEGAVLIKYSTGEVLFEKNKDEKLFPASTTKVLTGLIALEKLDMDTVVTVDAEAASTDGSRIYLSEGEQVTVEQLINAMLIYSANDAAIALAKEISGSVEEFAVLMNSKAKELGAVNSNFTTPNGLPDENHYTTAYDLALITRAAMQNNMFRQIVGTYEYKIPATNKYQARTLTNTNRLFWDNNTQIESNGYVRTLKYEGATGIKTGYTAAAGNCLVAGANRQGTEFIAVILQSQPTVYFADAIRLFDYGYNNYYFALQYDPDEPLGTIKVKGGAVDKVDVVCAEWIGEVISIDQSEDVVTTDIKIKKSLKAPFEAGTTVGAVKLYYNGELEKEYTLITATDSEASSIGTMAVSFKENVPTFLKVITFITLALLIGYLSLVIKVNRTAARRRKERKARKNTR